MLAGEPCSPPQRVSSTPRIIAGDAGLGGGAGGVAPLPRGAGSGFHWLRLAETRMSTGLRGARERALR